MSLCIESPFKFQNHNERLLAIWKHIANGTQIASGLLSATYNCWQRHYMYEQFCMQQHNEHFKPRMLLFSLGKGAMNALRNWQRCSKPSTILETAL
jgi:hypothetical protein